MPKSAAALNNSRWSRGAHLTGLLCLLAAASLMLDIHRVSGGTEPRQFTYWTTGPLTKVRPHDPPPAAAQPVRVFAARNEFESFQLVLRAAEKAVSGVDVQVSDLRNAGYVLPTRDITVYFERYLNLLKPSTRDSEAGEWPDPLIPRVDRYAGEKRNAFPFRLQPGRNQPVWIEIYVPQTAPPGEYTGQVRVSVAGRTEASIPISLHVWNFTLPSTSTLRNTFGFSGPSAVRGHYGRYTNDDDIMMLTRMYARAALLHRLSLHGGSMVPPRIPEGSKQVDWSAYDREMGPQITGSILKADDPLPGAHVTAVDVRLPAEISDAQQLLYYRQWIRHFQAKGWLPLLFNYLWDEPVADNFPKLVHRGQVAHAAGPEIRNLVTVSLDSRVEPVVDIWTPLINCLETKPGFDNYCAITAPRSAYDSELRAGKGVWWYASCASHGCTEGNGGEYFRGWPSYVIDAPAISNRILQSLAWKYGIQGELYFNTVEAFSKLNSSWDNVRLFGGNGDGTLFYPGKPSIIGGGTDIPIESIRLKLIRDGFEDYEYLALAAREGLGDVAQKTLATVATSLYDWTHSPDTFSAARQALGDALSRRVPSGRAGESTNPQAGRSAAMSSE